MNEEVNILIDWDEKALNKFQPRRTIQSTQMSRFELFQMNIR